MRCEQTFYGARDNCPPSGSIAYPPKNRRAAGGIGTHADPITFASDPTLFKPMTIIYVPRLKKYFRMEDQCEECMKEYKKSHKYCHVDLWMGPDTVTSADIVACENGLTIASGDVIVDPDQHLPVIATPLYDGRTNKCIQQFPKCVDQSTECGNSCIIPYSKTCAELAKVFNLPYDRFSALNANLHCTQGKVVKEGTSVCQGGSCGD